MSKLDDILADAFYPSGKGIKNIDDFKRRIKDVVLELVGDIEQRETTDMTLKSWSMDDYKAFGRNEYKIEFKNKLEEL